MNDSSPSRGNGVRLLISWTVVGIPLAWGIWNTLIKLPPLFR